MAPVWNPKEPVVPVDKSGNWQSYDGYADRWEKVEPFLAELEIVEMYSGRSAKGIILADPVSAVQYPMFIGDLVAYIKNGGLISNGTICSWWTASKRGQNYGIKPIPAPGA